MDDVLGWIAKNKEALGILGTAVGAIFAAGWAIYKFRKESKRTSPSGEATASTAQAPHVSAPPRAESHAASAAPNVIVLDCHIIKIDFDDAFVAREVFGGHKEAAIVVMRNDPVKGRRVAGMVNTRALLTVVPDVGKAVHIAAAQWLDSSLNCVDFEPGDTNKLVIAVRVPEVKSLAGLDDRRELNGPNEVRAVELPAKMRRADVTVKLVGGFSSEYVEEFRFELTVDPFAVHAT